MNWFCELKRWIRVYLCFLVPSLIAGILFFFQQWIAASVFVGIMIFFLLPLFIFSEEKFSEQRYNGIIEALQQNAMSDTPFSGKNMKINHSRLVKVVLIYKIKAPLY